MEIAAFTIALLALITSLSCLVWLAAKQMSTHAIQYVPLDNLNGLADIEDQPKNDKYNPSLADAYREFDALDPDEEEYFKKQQSKQQPTI